MTSTAPAAPSTVKRSSVKPRSPAWLCAAWPCSRIGSALVIAALAVAYAVAWRAPAVGTFHDDGVYAVTAKALAEGRGYRILSLPDEIAQTKYPFLFPALLAAVWRVFPRFPENAVYLKAVPLGCAVTWWCAGYFLVWRKTRDRRVALAVTALVAASPWVLFLSTALLSEMLFALLTVSALLL